MPGRISIEHGPCKGGTRHIHLVRGLLPTDMIQTACAPRSQRSPRTKQNPQAVPSAGTYTSVEPYIVDLITCQDSCIRHQPNSIHNQGNGEAQLTALTAVRAHLPKFTDRQFHEEPFVYLVTDLDHRNILVDDDWHMTSITDLEWAGAQSMEMMGPPEWLSGQSLEEIAFSFDECAGLHDELMDAFGKEGSTSYIFTANTKIMRACWITGKFWYHPALGSLTTLLALFIDRIQPRFAISVALLGKSSVIRFRSYGTRTASSSSLPKAWIRIVSPKTCESYSLNLRG